jgi:hypothetical protein
MDEDQEAEQATEATSAAAVAPVVVDEQKAWHWVSGDGVTWWPAYLAGSDHNSAGWTNTAPWPSYTTELLVGPAIDGPQRVALPTG